MGVFFYHQHIGSLLAKQTDISIFHIIDNFGMEYAVPLFFLLSGFCIHLANIKYLKTGTALPLKQYYKRRLLRIYPPYLFALLFVLAVNYVTYQNTYSLTDIAIHVFALQGFSAGYFNSINVVLWTITVELAFYLIYPAFYYLRNRYSLNKALLLILVISGISILYFSAQTSLLLPQRFFVLNLWFACCCGAYLADVYILSPETIYRQWHIILYACVAIAFVSIRLLPNNYPLISDQLNILIWTLPLVFIITNEAWLVKHQNALTNIIAKIGLSSYSLYLLHQPLIALKNYLAHRYLPIQFQLAGMSVGIVLIPLLAWYSFVFIEKPFVIRKKINEQAA